MGMPEPLDVWLGKDEVEGVPSPAAEGSEAAAALAARGGCRHRASPVADDGRRRAHRRVHPGPRHLRRVAARARRRRVCSAAAPHDGPRSDAVLGGHRAARSRRTAPPSPTPTRAASGSSPPRAGRRGSSSRPGARCGSATIGSSSRSSASDTSRLAVLDVDDAWPQAAVRRRRSGELEELRRRVGRGRLARRHGRRVRLHAAHDLLPRRDPRRRRRDRRGAGADRDRPDRRQGARLVARRLADRLQPRSAAAGTSST